MAVDITNIARMVFGVNFLGANGGADVNELWHSRFAEREAYLIDADAGEDIKSIFQRFRQQLIERGQNKMSNETCMLVFFVDYTVQLDDKIAAVVWNLRNAFSSVLSCQINAVIQFAYVGEKGLDETTVQRANIRSALEKNNQKDVYENYRLCLVGRSALQANSSGHWKSVIVFLDLLRRCRNLQNYLPMIGNLGQNNICFLRYGEFDEDHYRSLVNEQKRLEALLANNSSRELRTLVEAKRNEMVNFIESRYHVDGSLHPQHPDMIVEAPSGWFSRDMRAAAKRDRNPAYANAQQRTRAAVELTGERMRKEIEAWFDEQIAQAEQTLHRFFEEADVGIKLKLNPVEMKSVLYMPPYPNPGIMPSLTLRYSEQGADAEIGNYLTYIRDSCLCSGLKNYTVALQNAYEAIPQAEIQLQQRELERERNRASKELAAALDEEDFCKKVTLENPPESVFEINTQMNVRSAKFLMCRSASLPVGEKMAALGNITVHSVDDHMCGIVSFDAAPVKAVMLESVECTENVLDQLLPEVIYGF